MHTRVLTLIALALHLAPRSAHAGGAENASCAVWSPCNPGLTCDLTSFTCKRPGAEGDTCHATRPCDGALDCTLFKCVRKVASAPMCIPEGLRPSWYTGAGTCPASDYCHPLAWKCIAKALPCVPGGIPCPSGQMCSATMGLCVADEAAATNICAQYYDAQTHMNAISHAVNYVYGAGGGIENGGSGPSLTVEQGVIYGRDGRFGCYRSNCTGLSLATGVTGYATAGFAFDYDSMAGMSNVASAGVGTNAPIPAGVSATMVSSYSDEGRAGGIFGAVSLSVGMSAVPFVSASIWRCDTKVTTVPKPGSGGSGVSGAALSSHRYNALTDQPVGGEPRTAWRQQQIVKGTDYLALNKLRRVFMFDRSAVIAIDEWGSIFKLGGLSPTEMKATKLGTAFTSFGEVGGDPAMVELFAGRASCGVTANEKTACERGFIFRRDLRRPGVLEVYTSIAGPSWDGPTILQPRFQFPATVPNPPRVLALDPRVLRLTGGWGGIVYAVFDDGSLWAAQVETIGTSTLSDIRVRWKGLGPRRQTWVVVDPNPGWKTCDQIVAGGNGAIYCRIGGDLFVSHAMQSRDWQQGFLADWNSRVLIGRDFDQEVLVGARTEAGVSGCTYGDTQILTYSPDLDVVARPARVVANAPVAAANGAMPASVPQSCALAPSLALSAVPATQYLMTSLKPTIDGKAQALCAKADSFTPGALVNLASCALSGAPFLLTRWSVESVDGTYVQIVNRNGETPSQRLCLGVKGVDSHIRRALVQVYHCDYAATDPRHDGHWRVLQELDGTKIFVNRVSGLCLGVNKVDTPKIGSPVEVYDCPATVDDKRRDERWIFTAGPRYDMKPPVAPSHQTIASALPGLLLSSTAASGVAPTVQAGASGGTWKPESLWGVERIGTSEYARVVSRLDGRCLAAGAVDGARATLTACSDANLETHWSVLPDGERWLLAGRVGGLCLNIDGKDSGKASSPLAVWGCGIAPGEARLDSRWSFEWNGAVTNYARDAVVTMSTGGGDAAVTVDGLRTWSPTYTPICESTPGKTLPSVCIGGGIENEERDEQSWVQTLGARAARTVSGDKSPWLQVDLGASRLVRKIDVASEWALADGGAATVELRTTTCTGTSAPAFTSAPGQIGRGDSVVVVSPPVRARYACLRRAGGVSVTEIEVWGSP